MSQTLNTNFDGKYVFSGTRVTGKPTGIQKDGTTKNNSIDYINKDGSMPLDPAGDEYKQMNGKLKAEISEGVVMEYNVTAMEVLQGDVDLRKLLENIVNHLDSDDPKEINKLYGEDLGNIDKALDNVLRIRAEVGAKQNRMEAAKEMNKETNFNMTEILSNIEDVNYAENIWNLLYFKLFIYHLSKLVQKFYNRH